MINIFSNVICIDIITKEVIKLKNETLRRPLCMHGCVVIDYYDRYFEPTRKT